ncbi:MAG: hypothetical protein IKF52_00780 [Clostridia bacterium]|nr:hypothetical protein [Clostridia bacterium]
MTENYNNFCTYKITGEYVFDSNSKSFKLNSISKITVNKKNVMDNSFHLPISPFLKVEKLDFYIVRLGQSKKLWIPDDEDIVFIKNSFIVNHGISVFCDNIGNFCFLCETENEMFKIQKFLSHHRDYCAVKDTIIIS